MSSSLPNLLLARVPRGTSEHPLFCPLSGSSRERDAQQAKAGYTPPKPQRWPLSSGPSCIDTRLKPPRPIFVDAAVMGSCADGRFRDVVRILQQPDRLDGDGFTFQTLSGMANLFGFWGTTDGNLIPGHLRKIVPPCTVALPHRGCPAARLGRYQDLKSIM